MECFTDDDAAFIANGNDGAGRRIRGDNIATVHPDMAAPYPVHAPFSNSNLAHFHVQPAPLGFRS
jgi:hypothetical protein